MKIAPGDMRATDREGSLAAEQSLRFALNHMAAPQLKLGDFFALTRKLGLDGVEIRNDLIATTEDERRWGDVLADIFARIAPPAAARVP